MWADAGALCEIGRDADTLRDRLEARLTALRGELASLEAARDAIRQASRDARTPAGEGEIHCAACGRRVPDAPFCQHCGVPRSAIVVCPGCGDRTVTPVHLLAPGGGSQALHCTRCGAGLPVPVAPAAPGAAPEEGH